MTCWIHNGSFSSSSRFVPGLWNIGIKWMVLNQWSICTGFSTHIFNIKCRVKFLNSQKRKLAFWAYKIKLRACIEMTKISVFTIYGLGPVHPFAAGLSWMLQFRDSLELLCFSYFTRKCWCCRVILLCILSLDISSTFLSSCRSVTGLGNKAELVDLLKRCH